MPAKSKPSGAGAKGKGAKGKENCTHTTTAPTGSTPPTRGLEQCSAGPGPASREKRRLFSFRRGRGRGLKPAATPAEGSAQIAAPPHGHGDGGDDAVAATRSAGHTSSGEQSALKLGAPGASKLLRKRASADTGSPERAGTAAGPATVEPAGADDGALAQPPLKLGNPMASSLHRRRSLKLAGSKRHSSEVPARPRPASLTTASSLLSPAPLGTQQWSQSSPSVTLNLNLTPKSLPPSPIVWGFGAATDSPLSQPAATATAAAPSPAADSLFGFGAMEDLWSPAGRGAVAVGC